MLTTIIQWLDEIFTTMIFVPILFILYCRFSSFYRKSRKVFNLYRFCQILVALFILRYFCGRLIFTPVNYRRFTDSGLFPLIKAIFYPGYQ